MSNQTPPPPQGGYPFGQQPHQGQPGMPPAQGQSPYGQPPHQGQPGMPPAQGQSPYGQPPHQGHPGMPPNQGQQGMPPYGAPVPPEQPSKSKKVKKYLRFGIPLVVLAIAVGGYFFNKTDAEKVSAGDCVSIKGFGDVDLKQVDCDSSDATHKVLEKVEDDTSTEACSGVAGTTQQVYTKESSTDFSLCLGSAKS